MNATTSMLNILLDSWATTMWRACWVVAVEGGQMKRLILILLASTLLVGCGKSRPTYQLTVGTRTITLVVHDDPKRIQDDLISNIKPLWDEVKTGNSAEFYYTRTGPFSFGKGLDEELEQDARKKYGDRVKFTSTQTTKSPVWRFFKDRNGLSGFEQLDEGKPPLALCSEKEMDWGFVEMYLRRNTFSVEMVRLCIHFIDEPENPGRAVKDTSKD
jgi:hypothetical protein